MTPSTVIPSNLALLATSSEALDLVGSNHATLPLLFRSHKRLLNYARSVNVCLLWIQCRIGGQQHHPVHELGGLQWSVLYMRVSL